MLWAKCKHSQGIKQSISWLDSLCECVTDIISTNFPRPTHSPRLGPDPGNRDLEVTQLPWLPQLTLYQTTLLLPATQCDPMLQVAQVIKTPGRHFRQWPSKCSLGWRNLKQVAWGSGRCDQRSERETVGVGIWGQPMKERLPIPKPKPTFP